jgi:hypothetical protein
MEDRPTAYERQAPRITGYVSEQEGRFKQPRQMRSDADGSAIDDLVAASVVGDA